MVTIASTWTTNLCPLYASPPTANAVSADVDQMKSNKAIPLAESL